MKRHYETYSLFNQFVTIDASLLEIKKVTLHVLLLH